MELDVLLKLLLAFFLGGVIGFEREISQKEAGLRTNILIAVASTLLTIISQKIALSAEISDPLRIPGQIVSGIGFLGAGAIIQARFAIQGLTTAATIWTVASIGIAVGSGHYVIAFVMTILVVTVLIGLKYLTRTIHENRGIFLHKITVKDDIQHIYDLRETLSELNIRIQKFDFIKKSGRYILEMAIQTSRTKNKNFLEKAILLSGIIEILDVDLH